MFFISCYKLALKFLAFKIVESIISENTRITFVVFLKCYFFYTVVVPKDFFSVLNYGFKWTFSIFDILIVNIQNCKILQIAVSYYLCTRSELWVIHYTIHIHIMSFDRFSKPCIILEFLSLTLILIQIHSRNNWVFH